MKGDYPEAANDTAFTKKAALIQERLTFFKEVPSALSFFYKRPEVSMELLANKKQKVTEDMVPEILALLTETLEAIDEKKWNEENLKETLFALAKEKDLKNGQILWPLRATLTGLPYSPGAFEVAEVLGKEEVIARLKAAS
jgi:glutamyl-tRNA synthetase